MKAIFAAMALGTACASVQAQVLEPSKTIPATEQKKTAIKQDRARPAEVDYHRPHREKPPVTRETSEGTVKLDRVRPEPRRPSSAPSPAVQQQREQYRQRQYDHPQR